MDKFLRPHRLEIDQTSTESSKTDEFIHWKATVDNFLFSFTSPTATTENGEPVPLTDPEKYRVLINYVSPTIYKSIIGLTSYDTAMTKLESIFVKKKNETFSRYCLLTYKQKDVQTIAQFKLHLESLATECEFKDVNAELYKQETMRTAFISGISSNVIRQRLLEETKDWDKTVELAVTLEQALDNSKHYSSSSIHNDDSSFINATLENLASEQEND